MTAERMTHYQWRENLSGFEIQMKDEEEKKNKEIEELNERIRILEEKLDSLTNVEQDISEN